MTDDEKYCSMCFAKGSECICQVCIECTYAYVPGDDDDGRYQVCTGEMTADDFII